MKESFDKDVEATKLQTKYPTYSSLVISCNLDDKDLLLNPTSWEEGVLYRSDFPGKTTNPAWPIIGF